MSTRRHWLTHRGDLTALATDGRRLWFVTKNPERHATGLYQLDPLTGELSVHPFAGGLDLVYDGTRLVAAGVDGRVWAGPFDAFTAVTAVLDPAPVAVASLGEGTAALTGSELRIFGPSGAEEARFGLAGAGSVLVADPNGAWLVAGTRGGSVAVFHRAESGWQALESAALHQGEVTSLAFEPDELRFRSSGADRRFLVTHARGALEALDRGGRNGHDKPVRAIVVRGEWVYTTGDDGTIKAWRRGQKRKPATQKQGVGPAVAMVQVSVDGTDHLALACADATIRLFPIDAEGKPEGRTVQFAGAMASAHHELERKEPERRRAALETLERYADAASVELLASAATGDADHALRTLAAEMLGRSSNPRAVPPLEELLRADTESVRSAALAGLQRHVGTTALRPLELALDAGPPDGGLRAVAALTPLATQDAEAHARLVAALDHGHKDVRDAALGALETVHPADATASRLALRAAAPDIRWRALLRLLQRNLLEQTDTLLRAATDDPDSEVRQAAYLLRIRRYPALCAALRSRDPDFHRNLHALESYGQTTSEPPPAPAASAPTVLSPLIEAAASRQRDTCLRGASHLALLGDRRAFGVLLQLTREGEPAVQVRACRSLQWLHDARALGRMQAMLRIDRDEVRDAAFTVVERLLDNDPLQAAEIGLSAPHADVRGRGLRLLVGVLDGGERGERARLLLRRALDDGDAHVRTDAFKATLRLQVGVQGEGPAEALRFTLQSVQPAVRREALTEIMSQVREAWAWQLLLERLDDPDPGLRAEAYGFALKQPRGREPDPTVAALGGRYPDMRKRAVQQLAGRSDERAQALLVAALDDDEATVRRPAFEALQRSGQVDALVQALQSRHADVRIHAAARLAEAGRPEAYEALIAQVQEERLEVADLAKRWHEHVLTALRGLGWLRRAEAMGPLAKLLHDTDAGLRAGAASAMAQCAPDAAALAGWLEHSDVQVQQRIALGMAWRGDAAAAGVVFAKKARGGHTLAAALGLADDEQLLALLDAPQEAVRAVALRTVLLLEWAHDAFPERLLASLTVADAGVRLAVAQVLEVWHHADRLEAAIEEAVNQHGEHVIPVGRPVLRQLASVLAAGHGLDRADVVELLGGWFEPGVDTAQEARDLGATLEHRVGLVWARSAGRLEAMGDRTRPADRGISQGDAAELVFGTYVGLGGQAASPSTRAAALGRLARLQGVSREAVGHALVPALRDGHTAVRMAAFRSLDAIGFGQDALVAEALATGSKDLGQQALTLLADAGDTDRLWQVLAQRDDGLQIVAFDLLVERAGEQPAAVAALDARAEDARARGVARLSGRYDEADARQALTDALRSRFLDVRRQAALALATHRDDGAFDALQGMLDDDAWQARAIQALGELPHPGVGDAMIERIEQDPRGTARAADLLRAAGRTRNPALVGRLDELLKEREDLTSGILGALRTISGYDQRLDFDPREPDADESWAKGQHPRHDGVFARLLQLHADRGHTRDLRRLFTGAVWARGSDVDAPLGRMLRHADDQIRRMATEGLGLRVRYRHAEGAPLHALLTHKDAVTAFLAAEGLARAGANAGLSVLLATVDTIDTVQMRHRAVLALGHLGDERALDKLLDIVNDDAHALVESAAEAIGHLRNTPKRDEILRRLVQLSRGSGNVALRALAGLRWFGSPAAWARIRAVGSDHDGTRRVTVAELLRHDDTQTRLESQAVLERLITRDSWRAVVQTASVSLRRLLGPESLEPDYVFLRAPYPPEEDDTVPRLRERGEPARLLEVLAAPLARWVPVDALVMALTSRATVPVPEAIAHLRDPRPRAGAHAGRVLGWAPQLTAEAGESVRQATSAALDEWERSRDRDEPLGPHAERVRWLLWAAARHGVGSELVVRALSLHGPEAAPLHAAAAEALPLLEHATEQLVEVAQRGDARARSVAAGTLAARDPARAASLLPELLADRVVADPMLLGGVRPALDGAAASAHLQGVALPVLVAEGNVGALQGALQSDVEAVRRGAVEALGSLGAPEGEELLVAFASDASHHEEERKGAWRALRRSRRQRARAEVAS